MTPEQKAAMRQALEALESDPLDMVLNPDGHMGFRKDQAITAIREAMAEQPAPKDWKLVPRRATPEMLKAMDECSKEGYDERLYEGHAGSVYMAAVDAAPEMKVVPEQPAQHQEPVAYASDVEFDDETEIIPAEQKGKLGTAGLRIPLYIDPPASKPWVGLTTNELDEIDAPIRERGSATIAEIYRAIEAKLREKNA